MPRDKGAHNTYAVIPDSLGSVGICSLIGINSFEFVTNAFKAGAAPPGIKAQTDQEHVRRLRQEGYQVEVSPAYDEQGHPRPTLSAIWRKKR